MKRILTPFFALFVAIFVSAQPASQMLNDSAMAIYRNDANRAIKLLEEALVKAQDAKDAELVNLTKNNLGIVYRILGSFNEAKKFSSQALMDSKDETIIASALNNIGAVNRNLGLYEEALKAYLSALDIYEKRNDVDRQATTNNNIGMVYSYLGMKAKAIEYHLKAKDAFESGNNKKGLSESYNNIAIIYANDGELEKALEYFKFSLLIEEDLDDKKGISESANNVGGVYYYMQKVDSALAYFKKAAATERSIGNFEGVGAIYNNISMLLIENGQADASKSYLDSAYHFAVKTNSAIDIETSLNIYSMFYEAKGDTKSALKYFKNYTAFKDSLLNIETNAKVAKLEIEYQTEKKEKEILSQRAELSEKELHLNRKNLYIILLAGLAIVLCLLGYLLYSQQKLKNSQLQKENELKDALLKIETQNRLQEQRMRISRDLHDNIGAQITFIIASLDNLKYGFQLPEKLNQKLKNIGEFATATIYELRDTIWAMNKERISMEDLQTRTSNFLGKATTAASNIDFAINIDKTLATDITFSSVDGMNIYRIIQEAINNAIKYSEAKNIEVSFQKSGDSLEVSVTDDGRGFEPDKVENGNGLNNMKKRANDLGASVDVQTGLGKGTKVLLKIALENTANDLFP